MRSNRILVEGTAPGRTRIKLNDLDRDYKTGIWQLSFNK